MVEPFGRTELLCIKVTDKVVQCIFGLVPYRVIRKERDCVCATTIDLTEEALLDHVRRVFTKKEGVEMLFREAANRPQSSTLITIVKGPVWVRYTLWGKWSLRSFTPFGMNLL
jgi:hypothetical protein